VVSSGALSILVICVVEQPTNKKKKEIIKIDFFITHLLITVGRLSEVSQGAEKLATVVIYICAAAICMAQVKLS
jgi:hypothetical protein